MVLVIPTTANRSQLRDITMLNNDTIREILDSLRFEFDLLDSDMPQMELLNDTATIKTWVDDIKLGFDAQINKSSKGKQFIDELESLLAIEEALPPSTIDTSTIREIYFAIKSGELRPISFISRAGVRDFVGSEFVDVEKTKLPSSNEKHVYSARYAEVHVRALIEGLIAKYKPTDYIELISLFTVV